MSSLKITYLGGLFTNYLSFQLGSKNFQSANIFIENLIKSAVSIARFNLESRDFENNVFIRKYLTA